MLCDRTVVTELLTLNNTLVLWDTVIVGEILELELADTLVLRD